MSDLSSPKRTVLCFAPFGSYTVHHQFDAVAASALRLRGAEVMVLRCDGLLPGCDQFISGGDAASICAACRSCGDAFFAAFRLPTLQLRAALRDEDLRAAEQWSETLSPTEYAHAEFAGLPIGRWSTSSLLSFYRLTLGALEDPEMRAITAEEHRNLLVAGLLTYWAVTRIIEHTKPSHLFCFNARFATYRVAFEAARVLGVEVITHERGHADGTFTMFSNYGSIRSQPIFDGYQTWKDIPLTQPQLERVTQYFSNRERGSDSNFEPFLDFTTEYSAVRSLLRIPAGSRIVGVFTSSEYELALCSDYDAFANQLEVIERLMLVFRERPNQYLVIRHHPYFGGNQSSAADHGFIARANELARRAPGNVRFVMPCERLNTYALIHNIDAAIAFFSTTGVESVVRGVAAASFKQSAYRDAVTMTLEDDGKVYLHRLIDELIARTEAFGVEDIRRAYRYQSMIISKLSNRFETFGIKNTFSADLRVENFPMMGSGGDEALDRLCDHIFKGTPLLPQPSASDRIRATKEEDLFLGRIIEEAAKLRVRVREESYQACDRCSHDEVAVVVLQENGRGPLGLERSRHTQVHLSPLVCFDSCTYGDIASVLANTQAPFVTIAAPSTEYDEAFLSYGVDWLRAEGAKAKSGVVAGAWIRRHTGRIVDQIFSKRAPEVTVAGLHNVCPTIAREPYHLLSLALVRREEALAFLGTIAQLPLKSPEALRPIHDWLSDDTFIRSFAHGVVIPQ